MEDIHQTKFTTFYAVGLSYKKADAETRGKFSLDASAKEQLLLQAKKEGIEALIVTSTCNRTEIYGFAQHPFQLIKLLCENSHGTVEDFQKVAADFKDFDPMLSQKYSELNQDVFTIKINPEPILYIDNIDLIETSQSYYIFE